MSLALVAEFTAEADLLEALKAAPDQGQTVIDVYAPYPLSGADLGEAPARRVRVIAAVAGLCSAAAFYLLEWWTAVIAYPFNSGGRPPNSWPAFLLAPFEFGVFCAGFAGFVAFLVMCRLPRLHHPMFEAQHFDRAMQDRYFLTLTMNDQAQDFALAAGASAISVAEVAP